MLDLWFERVVKKSCRGEACLIRYADDYVCVFEAKEEAERFYGALEKRLGKFGLELSEQKTRIIAFSQYSEPGKQSFEFLGFEFRWGKDLKGCAHLKRRTSPGRLRTSLKRFTQWCRENRNQRPRNLFGKLNQKLRGYYNDYGVHGNSARLGAFSLHAMGILFKWLNRRSDRRSYNWFGFKELLEHFKVPRPRIVARPRPKLAASLS